MNSRMLRVGVMLNRTRIHAWEAWMLERVATSPHSELVLVLLNGAEGKPKVKRPLVQRVTKPQRDMLWNKYRDWDHGRHASEHDAYRWVDASEFLSTIPQYTTVPLKPKSYEFKFDDATLDHVRAADLDVMIRLGFGIIRCEILDIPRYGTWSFHRGDTRKFRGNPGLFWELHDRDPESGTVLQQLTEVLDGGHILYRSTAATNFDSYQLSRNPIQWKSAQFVERTLQVLHEGGLDALYASPHYEPPEADGPKPRRNPSNREMLRFLTRRAGRKVVRTVVPRRSATPPTIDPTFTWNGRPHRAEVAGPAIAIVDADAGTTVATFPTAAHTSAPVVHVADGHLWLFTTLAVDGASLDDELHVYHAAAPAGPWEPVAHNPVVSDARAARPAGPIEVADGTLVRPAWDAVSKHVRRFVIDTLEPNRFAQRELRTDSFTSTVVPLRQVDAAAGRDPDVVGRVDATHLRDELASNGPEEVPVALAHERAR